MESRKYPIGAEILDNGTCFRVYAPACQKVEIALEKDNSAAAFFDMQSEKNGYFSIFSDCFPPGSLYRFRIDGKEKMLPDPASRFQPDGPFGPSQVVNPSDYRWNDSDWKGIDMSNQIIYEMHLGTFTPEGTLEAAGKELKELAALGVSTIELMPLNDFPGKFGWGYDGVNLFAPTRLYGTPNDLRRFIDDAHMLGLGVILDVVYNHFGPDGNFISEFTRDYYLDEQTGWGTGINYDKKEIREFFLANAQYWINEYHFDGLRVDATHVMVSETDPHFLKDLAEAAHTAAAQKKIVVIAENEKQLSVIPRPIEQGGYGFDGIWNDDFHHSARVRLVGKREAYYADFLGHPQELVSCFKHGFLYQGQYYGWFKKGRGTPELFPNLKKFVIYLQNHDQIANSGQGHRIHELANWADVKAMTCLLILGSCTPLIFQGQEFASSSPFLFFADHSTELGASIHKGRKKFLAQFPHLFPHSSQSCIADPANEQTFLQSKLKLSERKTHAWAYNFHKDLFRLKREDPIFSGSQPNVDGAVLGNDALLIRYITENSQDRLIAINFGADLFLDSVPEPLFAPCEGCAWELMWSSEAIEYRGQGTPMLGKRIKKLPAHSALIFKSVALSSSL